LNHVPLHVDEAQRIVITSITKTTNIIEIELTESSGCILAEDITADSDIPLFDRSMMDGFAVRSEDTLQASTEFPISLTVVEDIPAGVKPLKQLLQGEAARIMTGAMLPDGADAVCRFEATKDGFQIGVQTVQLLSPVSLHENVALQGEDISKGTIVLTKGTKIGAAEIAVLATFGKSRVAVYRKPVVAILSSGSELIEVHEALQPGKIRNSNTPMVADLIRQAGGIPLLLKPTMDNIHLLTNELKSVLDQVDLVVTTGGVSVGDFDVMPDVYANLGAITQFWKVLLKPGGPFRYAMHGDTPFFGLSGNPAASFVNTQLFVLPALRRMSGQSIEASLTRMCKATLTTSQAITLTSIKQTRFFRATAFLEEGQLYVSMPQGQASGMIGSLVGANCLIRLDGEKIADRGEQISILPFGELQLR
jgi:molybdopterin molybdotransferase